MNYKSLLKKIFMYSSYVLSIQLVFCASLLASKVTMGQKAHSLREIWVSMDFEDHKIIDAFNNIEEETGFTFVYLKNEIDQKLTLSGSYDGTNLYDLLSSLSRETGLRFHRVNNNINVKKLRNRRRNRRDPVIIEEKTITGKVTDELGNELPGVNVLLKGTNVGTVTDVSGKYSINVPDDVTTLVFSYIGFLKQEVEVGDRSIVDVRMALDSEMLNEVVVVGYGTQKKVNLTGAVDNIDFEKEIGNRPVGNISQMLQGTLPNVNFSATDGGGEPGAALNINIRGTGTLTGNEGIPFILLDGIPISVAQMNSINPNDIKEVTILKDAASAAIYGARGAYGVILITTKKGEENGKITVNYSTNIAIATPVSLPQLSNSLDFARAYNQAITNDGQAPMFDDNEIQDIIDYQNGVITADTEPNAAGDWYRYWHDGWANYDWFDLMYESAPRQTHSLSVSGGTEKTSYFISGGFFKQLGNLTYADDEYQRSNITVNLRNQTTDWLSFDVSTKYARERNLFPSGGFGGFDKNIIYHQISRLWPVVPLYSPDGSFIVNQDVKRMMDSGRTTEFKNNLLLTLATEIEPIKGWVTRISFNWAANNENRVIEQFRNLIPAPDGTTVNAGHNQNSISRRLIDNTDRLINAITRYEKDFKLHHLGIMVGYEQRIKKEFETTGTRADLITNSLPTFSTATGVQTVDDALFDFSTQGFFARLNYNFNEKFLFETNLRYDGSSFFREGNRWGLFPSFSVGYNMAKENYWAPLEKVISLFKLRGSWGSLGNHDPELAARYQELMSAGQSSWIIGGQRAVIVAAPNLISPDLTWETSTTFNVGLDATIFDRLQINFDWYRRVTSDMVGPAVSLPATLGTGAPQENNSELETKGWELILGWQGNVNAVGYSVRLNVSDNRSVVLRYPNDSGTLDDWFDGRVIGDIHGLTTSGFFESDAEAAEAPDQSLFWNSWGAGDIRYADLDNDGVISQGEWTKDNMGDYQVIGNNTPRYSYGLNLGASFKGFNLSVLVQGVAKRDIALSESTNLFWGFRGSQWQNTIHRQALNYWTPERTDAYFPKPYMSSQHLKNTQTQTRYLQNGAYMRLKNVQLSYQLPETLISKLGLNSLQVYFSGDNLLTFTDLIDTFDPETVDGAWGDGKIYPLQRVFSAGLNVSF